MSRTPVVATDLLSPDQAEAFAQVALANVVREFPAKLDHVMGDARDVRGPRELHPAFYGSFDWHSCVHMHWLLVRARRLYPGLPSRATIDAVLDLHLTPANIAAECAYLARPQARAFERTYGWAWLLELAHELLRSGEDAGRWSRALAPLAHAVVERYLDYLPRQRYALRHGLHANSAFGLVFALDYARSARQPALAGACVDAAERWFAGDRDVPASWEPSGIDFLSPSLMEADLMRRVLDCEAYESWLAAFLPALARDGLPPPFEPVTVDDRSDGYIVHLDGLNLSRAWNLRGIVAGLPADDARLGPLRHLAALHLAAGLEGLRSEDYGGQHWLATFAMLALTADVDAASGAPARLAAS